MSSDPTFPNTAQILREDSARALRFWAVLTAVLLGGWATWFIAAKVPVYAQSETARFESIAVHWIEAPVAGRILTADIPVGRDVRKGDVLIELDASAERLRESREVLLHASAIARSNLLREQLRAAQSALAQSRDVAAAAAAEARARYDEAAGLARLAEAEAQRARTLFRQGLVSEVERDAASADATRKRATAITQESAMRRIEAEHRVAFAVRQGEVDRLAAELAELVAQARSSDVATRILKTDVERRLIRSPVAGRIASEVAKRAGSFVQEGERLTAVVPPGAITAVGYYRPEFAVGRIRPGQRARFRVDAFPPIEYGWIEGHVRSIGAEPKDGHVRVEVVLTPRNTRIPLEHGLTGSLSVETESISPLVLVLRSAGRRT